MIETIRTERLILKEIKTKHYDDYQRQFGVWDIIRFFRKRVPWPFPEGETKRHFETTVLPTIGKELWQWGIFLQDKPDSLIGSISIRKSHEDNRGFWLAKKYWGHGYMQEASTAVTNYAFNVLGFQKLLLTNAKGNIRSGRMKEIIGLDLVKVTPVQFNDPDLKECEHWELTKSHWKKYLKRKRDENCNVYT